MSLFKRRRSHLQHQPAASWTCQFQDQLPSRDDHWAFIADVSVEWSLEASRPALGVSNLLAARQVRLIAEPVAARVSVLRISAAEQDVNAALATALPSSGNGVHVHRARVRLHVDDATLQAAQQWHREQEDLRLEGLRQERLRARMRFMRTEVLRDPAGARIYWLLENLHQPDPLAHNTALDDLVRQVSLWQSENRWVTIAQLLHRFIERLPDSRRSDLLKLLTRVFIEYGEDELAEEMSRSWHQIHPSPGKVVTEDRLSQADRA